MRKQTLRFRNPGGEDRTAGVPPLITLHGASPSPWYTKGNRLIPGPTRQTGVLPRVSSFTANIWWVSLLTVPLLPKGPNVCLQNPSGSGEGAASPADPGLGPGTDHRTADRWVPPLATGEAPGGTSGMLRQRHSLPQGLGRRGPANAPALSASTRK